MNFVTDPVKISSKSGFPIDDAESEDGQEDGQSVTSSVCPTRPRNETPDERRERKQAVKDAQREARMRKKQTKMLYRQETLRQQRQLAAMPTKHASVIEL